MRGDLAPGLRGETRVREEPRVVGEEAKYLAIALHRSGGRRDAAGACGPRRREGDRGRDEQQTHGTSAQPQGSQNMTSWS